MKLNTGQKKLLEVMYEHGIINTDAEKVCKWITNRVEEGRGAVVFSLEENDGLVGVWIGEPAEHERALGYGDDVIEAVLDAIRHEATEHSVQSDGALPSVEEVICPICQSIVRLYDGNKVGMHTPHSNANEPICKMVGSEIMPRR